jgi:hypothetical protein
MRKSKIMAVTLTVALVFSNLEASAGIAVAPAPGVKFGTGATGWVWGVFGCAGGIVFTALVANYYNKRQLTWNEAATCGLLFWFKPLNPNPGNPVR